MKKLITLAAAAMVLTGAQAPANETRVTTRATIETADLDLSRASDARKLAQRVARATSQLCGYPISAPGQDRDDNLQCRAEVARQLEPKLALLRARSRLAGN